MNSAPRASSDPPTLPARATRVAARAVLPAVVAAVLALPTAAADARAQGGSPPVGADTADTVEAPGGSARSPEGEAWHFPVGERTVYDVVVSMGRVATSRPLGEARMTVEGRERVDGTEAYRASLEVEGRIPFVYEMNNRQVSWILPDPIRSARFEEHLREGDYRRDRRYRLDQEEGVFTRFDQVDGGWKRVEEQAEVPMPEAALDEVSFLYFVRTLPLEPGQTYRYERFFEEDGNPVVIEVLDRETVRVPAGRFETVVVRPILRTGGLFSEGGRARVWITDDDRRLIVKIESRMKVGRVDMHLRSHRAGGDGPDGAGGRDGS